MPVIDENGNELKGKELQDFYNSHLMDEAILIEYLTNKPKDELIEALMDLLKSSDVEKLKEIFYDYNVYYNTRKEDIIYEEYYDEQQQNRRGKD